MKLFFYAKVLRFEERKRLVEKHKDLSDGTPDEKWESQGFFLTLSSSPGGGEFSLALGPAMDNVFTINQILKITIEPSNPLKE